MGQFVILGVGNTSDNIIEDCLSDLPKDSTFSIYTYRTNLEGVCRVYDWLLDNKAPYIAYHNNTAPPLLLNSAIKVIEASVDEMIDVTQKNMGTVLYLWDDKDEVASEKEVTKLIDNGLRVLDLTQGLTPFLIVDTKKAVNNTVDSLKPITREEYEEMPLASLKQQAAAHGVEKSKSTSKENIINELTKPESKEVLNKPTATVVIVSGELTRTFRVTEKEAQQLINDLNDLT